MNWKECAQLVENAGAYTRFDWPRSRGRLGFDCNPDAFTINDLTGAAGWLWTWPSDWLLSRPGVQSFLEMEPQTVVGSGWSYALPVVAYVLFIVTAAIGDHHSAVRKADRRSALRASQLGSRSTDKDR